MNTSNNHIEIFDTDQTDLIGGKYSVQYGLGNQRFLDMHDILDGRKHLVAHYASENATLTISVVENELSDCLMENDNMCANHVWTGLNYIGSFQTESEASALIAEFLKIYELYYFCDEEGEFSDDFTKMFFCYDNVSRSIARKVDTRVSFSNWLDVGLHLLHALYVAHGECEMKGGGQIFDLNRMH